MFSMWLSGGHRRLESQSGWDQNIKSLPQPSKCESEPREVSLYIYGVCAMCFEYSIYAFLGGGGGLVLVVVVGGGGGCILAGGLPSPLPWTSWPSLHALPHHRAHISSSLYVIHLPSCTQILCLHHNTHKISPVFGPYLQDGVATAVVVNFLHLVHLVNTSHMHYI